MPGTSFGGYIRYIKIIRPKVEKEIVVIETNVQPIIRSLRPHTEEHFVSRTNVVPPHPGFNSKTVGHKVKSRSQYVVLRTIKMNCVSWGHHKLHRVGIAADLTVVIIDSQIELCVQIPCQVNIDILRSAIG